MPCAQPEDILNTFPLDICAPVVVLHRIFTMVTTMGYTIALFISTVSYTTTHEQAGKDHNAATELRKHLPPKNRRASVYTLMIGLPGVNYLKAGILKKQCHQGTLGLRGNSAGNCTISLCDAIPCRISLLALHQDYLNLR